ncbi:hypothetical protein RvY_07494 [Ramazzottius varieornatus]|uniref:Uncharacterized protein n=1 Tax=Ramazzottius varieornatus TaxID=947166 RepID=A0A1D1V4Y6_RAMVA|nr:hypothetical protein RvY_07494 [Ramazzottius varieornatus]
MGTPPPMYPSSSFQPIPFFPSQLAYSGASTSSSSLDSYSDSARRRADELGGLQRPSVFRTAPPGSHSSLDSLAGKSHNPKR